METFWKKAVNWLPVLALMVVIFVFSSLNGHKSDSMSGPIVTIIVNFVEQVTEQPVKVESSMMELCVFIVRKSAHMAEYALLAAAFCFALKRTFSVSRFAMGAWALSFAVFYAATDEFHQMLVPGRTGKLADVGIDALGALLGICVFFLVWRIIRRRREKKENIRKIYK